MDELNDFHDTLDEFGITQEELEANLKQAVQDCNDGFTYTMLQDENGKIGHDLRCDKCQRVGKLFERPFPHKLNCPMARL